MRTRCGDATAKVREQVLTWLQFALHFLQRVVDAQAKQKGHQRVALLAALVHKPLRSLRRTAVPACVPPVSKALYQWRCRVLPRLVLQRCHAGGYESLGNRAGKLSPSKALGSVKQKLE